MNVAEAKTRVCPFIQDGRIHLSHRKDYADQIVTNITCVADQCMAWVWDVDYDSVVFLDEEGVQSTTSGSCGLVGCNK